MLVKESMKMHNVLINNRLRIYLYVGLAGLLAISVFLQLTNETFMIFLPLLFNLILVKKFVYSRRILFTGMVSVFFTTLVFLIQYEQRKIVDWSCIPSTSDWSAHLSYSSTMILFSVIIWEISFLTKKGIADPPKKLRNLWLFPPKG